MRAASRIPVFLAILFTLFSASVARDTITPTQPLSGNETLVSSGGSFALGFFTPPNSNNRYIGIWYEKIVDVQTVVWVANRKIPVTNSTGTLSISSNGSLGVTDQNATAIVWSTPATGLANPVAQLLDNGNLVVIEAGSSSNNSEHFAWQSFDHPTDTLLPGMKLGWNLTSGLNRNLTGWKSRSDPSPGEFALSMDVRGDPQLAFWDGPNRGWRSGPWTGYQFSGVPETKTYTMFDFHFVNNKTEVYYSYDLLDKTIVTRLVMNESGVVQRLVWLDGPGVWNVYWYTPKSACDGYGPCGPFGLCDPNDSPICSCMPGFVPKSQEEWALRDGTGGCVRSTPLDCRGATDGFARVQGVLLPDTVNVTVDMDISLDECKLKCLRNCSCSGYANADVRGGGSGCITWAGDLMDASLYIGGGQDVYLRLAAADLGSASSQSRKKGQTTLAIVLSTVLPSLLLMCIACSVWRSKRRRKAFRSFDEDFIEERSRENDIELPLFDIGTVAAATNNFSIENKLGEGGFGPVYRGNLGQGQEIAVKALSKTSTQGIDEFKNEVMLIAKLQHRNLVRLLGCCIHGEERMLIYEYMPNRSLDVFLFDVQKTSLLDWSMRYRIIEGIGRGLIYLHEDSRFRIIHRDLKASNILLDKDMNPKISDFGMARVFGGDEIKAKTLKVVGTYGYMSPEYAMDGIFSVKSDVFSFGVLVLEIISGVKNKGVYLSEAHQYLLGRAWSLWREGNALQLVDAALGQSYPEAQMMRCIKIGLLCVQEYPEDRPTMSAALLILASEQAAIPEPKQPGFVVKRGSLEVDTSSSKLEFQSYNDLTFSMSTGR